METLLLHESVNQAWGARDRSVLRATEHVFVTGPSAKEAESWALQPGCRVGINVHKRYAQVAVLDEAGKITEEVRVENANLNDLAQRYAGAEAAIKATSNYYHIHATLSEHLDVVVAHPRELTLIADTDKKTDRVDAKELARMVRLGSVPESYVPTDEIREARARVRGRQTLVENRTKCANKIHGLLSDHGITEDVKR